MNQYPVPFWSGGVTCGLEVPLLPWHSPTEGHVGVSGFQLGHTKLLWDIHTFLHDNGFSFLWDICPGMQRLGHMPIRPHVQRNGQTALVSAWTVSRSHR